jgi:hypothetical protein
VLRFARPILTVTIAILLIFLLFVIGLLLASLILVREARVAVLAFNCRDFISIMQLFLLHSFAVVNIENGILDIRKLKFPKVVVSINYGDGVFPFYRKGS